MCRGVGVEDITPEVVHGELQMGFQPAALPPQKRSWPHVESCHSSTVPNLFLRSGLVGACRLVALGTIFAYLLSGVHWVNTAACMSWAARGGMGASGAHDDNNLPFDYGVLVPPLEAGLP